MTADLPRRPRRLALHLGLGAVAAAVGLKVGTMLVVGLLSTGAYAVQDYAGSERFSEFLLLGNIAESHTAHFNLGTARAAQGDLTGARDALRGALELVPATDECPVRLNLGLVLEALAARQAEAGHPDASLNSAEAARRVTAAAPPTCLSGALATLDARLKDGAGEPPKDGASETAESMEEPTQDAAATGGTPLPSDKEEALDEIQNRMTAGQGDQRSEQLPTGDGPSKRVSRPW